MRPYHDYAWRGGEAFEEGLPMKSPYPVEEIRGAQWIVGWRKGALDRAIEDEGFGLVDEDDVMIADADWFYAQDALDRALRTLAKRMPSVEEVERHAGPSSEWPTNCYAVATALFESGMLRELDLGPHWRAHGMWDGDVAPGSPFAGKGACMHGWVEFEAGFVVDPTRWVFEDVAPYVAVAPIGEYDFGKARMVARSRIGGKCDRAVGSPLDVDPDGPLASVLSREVGEGPWNEHDLRTVLGGPVEDVGDDLPAVVEEVMALGLPAHVPMDVKVMLEDREATSPAPGPAPGP